MKIKLIGGLFGIVTLISLLIIIGCEKEEPGGLSSTQIENAQLYRSEESGELPLERNTMIDPELMAGEVVSESIRPLVPETPGHRRALRSTSDIPTITPSSFYAELARGQCAHLTKELFVPGDTLLRADILFAVDLTGSMYGEIYQLQLEIQNIADQLNTLIEEPAFGVVTHMDYPGYYSYCGYSDYYGDASYGDYPYLLNQPINTDVNLTKTAINSLSLGYGEDGPESYARVLHETYNDPSIGWRTGARRIVVFFGDALPHDCNVGSCISESMGSTGIDPGSDAVAGTSDDLPIMTVVNNMATNNITLIYIFSGFGSTYLDLWQCWSQITGGTAVQINSDGTVPGGMDLAELIYTYITPIIERCSNFTLQTDPPEYTSWIQNLTPPGYTDLTLPATVVFDLDICVPDAAPGGLHIFQICGSCDGGFVVCETDSINVPEGPCNPADLFLLGYQTIDYTPPLWTVRVELRNNGPGDAWDVAATMNEDIPWLVIPDPSCFYGTIPAGGTSWGDPDVYVFDLSSWPGGSFNVWFDVTYEDECGSQRVHLDPEFSPGDDPVIRYRAPDKIKRIKRE